MSVKQKLEYIFSIIPSYKTHFAYDDGKTSVFGVYTTNRGTVYDDVDYVILHIKDKIADDGDLLNIIGIALIARAKDFGIIDDFKLLIEETFDRFGLVEIYISEERKKQILLNRIPLIL